MGAGVPFLIRRFMQQGAEVWGTYCRIGQVRHIIWHWNDEGVGAFNCISSVAMHVGDTLCTQLPLQPHSACPALWGRTQRSALWGRTQRSARGATIWAPGRTRDPYFGILGASLLSLVQVLTPCLGTAEAAEV
jgi:hypothetical protein